MDDRLEEDRLEEDRLEEDRRPRVPVRGRVILSDEGRARIATARGVFDLTLAGPAPAIGAWVTGSACTDEAGQLVDARLEVASPAPRDDFPRPDGEWMALHGPASRAERLRQRAAIVREVRRWFDERGFLEVETPLAVPSPGLDLHLAAFEVRGLGPPRWLITSPEYQMKRLIAGGLTDIYQLCRCFRRDEAGAHHQPEFTMLEWYRGFADVEDVMADTEALVSHVAASVLGTTTIPGRGRPLDVRPPWPRLTVAEAIERHAGLRLADVLPDEERFFRVWIEEVEPRLGVEHPAFVTRWPASMASLARLAPDDPRYAERVEAYVDGLELSNGFSELVDAHEQRARLRRDHRARVEEGLDPYPVDERFLAALEEGLPPSGGNALGVDRLVMLLTGARSIDEVIAFDASRL